MTVEEYLKNYVYELFSSGGWEPMTSKDFVEDYFSLGTSNMSRSRVLSLVESYLDREVLSGDLEIFYKNGTKFYIPENDHTDVLEYVSPKKLSKDKFKFLESYLESL